MLRLLCALLLATAADAGMLLYPQEVPAVRVVRSAVLDNYALDRDARWRDPVSRVPIFSPDNEAIKYVVTDNHVSDLRGFTVGDTLYCPGNGDPEITATWVKRIALGVPGAFYRDYGDLRGIRRVEATLGLTVEAVRER